jgi:hypothetical protein
MMRGGRKIKKKKKGGINNCRWSRINKKKKGGLE